tara:strand:+ start:818543 stop:819208 length:666 start_codon:yes stop_codon:yes gene_type:complete
MESRVDPQNMPQSIVYVIDDHPQELLLIRRLCESVNLEVQTFDSPDDFLKQVDPKSAGCVVVDLLMPQMSGLDVQTRMLALGVTMPIIVVTGHADTGTCRTAFKKGVFDFLEKGFEPHDLLTSIQRALEANEQHREKESQRGVAMAQLDALTQREVEVMRQLAQGNSLKEIAGASGISVQTASKHRCNIFRKLDVNNEVDLLKLLISIDPEYASLATGSTA